MDKFPDLDFRGPRVRVNAVFDPVDYERLQIEAKRSGLSMSAIIHGFVELMRLRIAGAELTGDSHADKFAFGFEAFAWLIALDSKLVTPEEYAGAASYAQTAGRSISAEDRLRALFTLLQDRFASRGEYTFEDDTEAAEPVDDDHPARTKAEIEAKRQELERNKPKPDAGAAE